MRLAVVLWEEEQGANQEHRWCARSDDALLICRFHFAIRNLAEHVIDRLINLLTIY